MTPDIDPQVRNEICHRLAGVEATENVRLLLAIESGSRAWGFPSPDSDFDVRFIYVRTRDWYLGLEPGRDVIEQPIADDIDLNGWDVRKALRLILNSNAVVCEWLASPIRYAPDDPKMPELTNIVRSIFNPRGIAHHYANLGKNAAGRWLGGSEDVPVKRYFYALRPALAIRALRHDSTQMPPMNLQDLMDVSAISSECRVMINELVEAKSQTRELANVCRMPKLDLLITDELQRAGELPVRHPGAAGTRSVNQFFLNLVNT